MALSIRNFPRHVVLRELEQKPYMARTLSPADRAWLGLPALEGGSDGLEGKEAGSAKVLPFGTARPPSLTVGDTP